MENRISVRQGNSRLSQFHELCTKVQETIARTRFHFMININKPARSEIRHANVIEQINANERDSCYPDDWHRRWRLVYRIFRALTKRILRFRRAGVSAARVPFLI